MHASRQGNDGVLNSHPWGKGVVLVPCTVLGVPGSSPFGSQEGIFSCTSTCWSGGRKERDAEVLNLSKL